MTLTMTEAQRIAWDGFALIGAGSLLALGAALGAALLARIWK